MKSNIYFARIHYSDSLGEYAYFGLVPERLLKSSPVCAGRPKVEDKELNSNNDR